MNKKILIIDDDELIRSLIKATLEKEHFIIIEAENGKDGVTIAEKGKPDLILVDMLMPDIGGEETIKLIHEKEELKNIPILVMTAKDFDQELAKALQAGAKGYMNKRYKPEQILEKIKEFI